MTKLVRMHKDGASLDVHPTCVAAHEAAGWLSGSANIDTDTAALAPEGGAKAGNPLEGLTVTQLKELAVTNKVDLGDAKRKDDIIAALVAAAKFAGEPDPAAEVVVGENTGAAD